MCLDATREPATDEAGPMTTVRGEARRKVVARYCMVVQMGNNQDQFSAAAKSGQRRQRQCGRDTRNWTVIQRATVYAVALMLSACTGDEASRSLEVGDGVIGDMSARIGDDEDGQPSGRHADEWSSGRGDSNDAVSNSVFPGLLQHLSVKLGPLVLDSASSGDLVLDPDSPGPISAFGGPDPEGAGVRPNIAFRTKIGAKVRSPLKGRLLNKLWQSPYGDWELHIVAEPPIAAKWLVILDHVQDVALKKGDLIAQDSVLGVAAKWQPNYSMVELHILREPEVPGVDALHVCPLDVLAPSQQVAVTSQMNAVFAAMVTPPYAFAEASREMVRNGCVCSVIAETPGRAGRKLKCD